MNKNQKTNPDVYGVDYSKIGFILMGSLALIFSMYYLKSYKKADSAVVKADKDPVEESLSKTDEDKSFKKPVSFSVYLKNKIVEKISKFSAFLQEPMPPKDPDELLADKLEFLLIL